jgi:hypothetical protein
VNAREAPDAGALSGVMSYCPHCQRPVEVPLPVEPLWSLPSAALLVPMHLPTLKRWLQKHKHDAGLGAPQYTGAWGRRHRMLTGADIRFIRSIAVSSQYRRRRSA